MYLFTAFQSTKHSKSNEQDEEVEHDVSNENDSFEDAVTHGGHMDKSGDMLSGTKDMAHMSVQVDSRVTANDYETSPHDQKADGQNSSLETDRKENRTTATPISNVFLMSQRLTCSRLLLLPSSSSSSSLLSYYYYRRRRRLRSSSCCCCCCCNSSRFVTVVDQLLLSCFPLGCTVP